MDYFAYKNNKLYCEDVDLQDIAMQCGTPCYVYSKKTLGRHVDVYKKAFKSKDNLICFSVKSLSNISILEFINFQVVKGLLHLIYPYYPPKKELLTLGSFNNSFPVPEYRFSPVTKT